MCSNAGEAALEYWFVMRNGTTKRPRQEPCGLKREANMVSNRVLVSGGAVVDETDKCDPDGRCEVTECSRLGRTSADDCGGLFPNLY